MSSVGLGFLITDYRLPITDYGSAGVSPTPVLFFLITDYRLLTTEKKGADSARAF